jgi:alkylhydroperoxidase family enzyme
MTFIETVPEAEAAGAVQEMYETDRATFGDLPNLTRAFSLRPEVYAAWRQLNGSIKAGMELRRYELATLAAARRLRSSYCSLAHGSVLLNNAFVTAPQLRALMDGDAAGADAGGELSPTDRAVMELADKVADDATTVTESDCDRLRALGLSDTDILDVVLTAAARCFFSKCLDALGAAPDAKYAGLDPDLRDALTVGRPIATE